MFIQQYKKTRKKFSSELISLGKKVHEKLPQDCTDVCKTAQYESNDQKKSNVYIAI